MAKQKFWNGIEWEEVRTSANKVTLQDVGNIIDSTDIEGAIQEIETKRLSDMAEGATKVELAAVASGSPKGVYATLVALQSAYPTGTSGIYLVTADGKWYYWNGSAWTIGGTYQATGIANDGVTPINISKGDYLVPTWVDIVDRTKSVLNKIMNNAGTEQAFAGFSHTDYLPIIAGLQYQMYMKDNNGNVSYSVQLTYYDSAKVFLGYKNNTAMPYTWTAPANAAYAIFNYGTVYESEIYFKEIQQIATKYNMDWLNVKLANLDPDVTTYIQNLNNETQVVSKPWLNKKANFNGDSITYGTYTPEGEVTPNGRVANRWCDLVGAKLGLSLVRNYAVSGVSVSSTSSVNPTLALASRYSYMDNDADLIVYLPGTNDYGTSVVLGTIADATDISFYGALRVLCNGLVGKYLGKKIVFITPLHRGSEGANAVGATLAQYRQAILEVCSLFGIHVIDGFSLGITLLNSTFASTYFGTDTLHPNEAGHALIANNATPKINAV